jgi:hypothetical protein
VRVTSLPVDTAIRTLLPHARMSDAYRLVVDERVLDAAVAADRIFGRAPWWIRILLGVRNRLVAPFGLKTSVDQGAQRIGFFPVITQTPRRVLLGFDDKHLDFRVAVDVMPVGPARHEVTVTTLVRTHNLPGRMYLALVLPFHRVIVPAMLGQAART